MSQGSSAKQANKTHSTELTLDNSAGYAPNAISEGLPAAHNSDGFDISECSFVSLTNNTVINQDDCVAVTSGNNITVDSMYCSGGHGLSIGSVGGKSDNIVTNITFSNRYAHCLFQFGMFRENQSLGTCSCFLNTCKISKLI